MEPTEVATANDDTTDISVDQVQNMGIAATNIENSSYTSSTITSNNITEASDTPLTDEVLPTNEQN